MKLPGSLSSTSISNISLFMAAVIGAVIAGNQSPLKSRRPELGKAPRMVYQRGQVVSRLWEDPFEAVRRWEAEGEEDRSVLNLQPVDAVFSQQLNTLIVPVIVDASHYSEPRESRIQQRYALLAALNVSGYKRNDAGIMHLAKLTIDGVDSHVPYEWFSLNNLKSDIVQVDRVKFHNPLYKQPKNMDADLFAQVCVLWIPDNFAGRRTGAIRHPEQGPLSDFKKLTKAFKITSQKENSNDVRIIGPRSSDDIELLIQEMKQMRSGEAWFREKEEQLIESQAVLDAWAASVSNHDWLKEEVLKLDALSKGGEVLEDAYTLLIQEFQKQILKYSQSNWALRSFREVMPLTRPMVAYNKDDVQTNLLYYGEFLQKRAELSEQKLLSEKIAAYLMKHDADWAEIMANYQAAVLQHTLLREGTTGSNGKGRFVNDFMFTHQLAEIEARSKRTYVIALLKVLLKEHAGLDTLNASEIETEIEHYFEQQSAVLNTKYERHQKRFDDMITLCDAAISQLSIFHSKSRRYSKLNQKVLDFKESTAVLGSKKALEGFFSAADKDVNPVTLGALAKLKDEAEKMQHRYASLQKALSAYEKDESFNTDYFNSLNHGKPVCSVFSPWATADNFVLSHDNTDAWEALRKRLSGTELTNDKTDLVRLRKEILNLHGVHFNRTIHKDSRVTLELLKELQNRGVKISSSHGEEKGDMHGDHIVLIREWDALFSRALSSSLEIQQKDFEHGNPLSIMDNDWPENLHVFEYLRGIDGLVPGGKHEALPDPISAGSDAAGGKTVRRYPSGSGQYDYLRRLADRIRSIGDTHHKVKAIGVFGSDPYDKLLVLRALRTEMPDVIFFTTDLDARFFHEEEQEWTRGLLVGSSYGLELKETLQKGTAPFRNAYQTSNFATMLTVLHGSRFVFDIDDYPPQIFEIGRNGAYNLMVASEGTGCDSERPLFPKNPHTWEKHRIGIYLWIVFLLLLPALFLGLKGYVDSKKEKGSSLIWVGFILICCVGSAGLGWMIRHDGLVPGIGEPVVFTEGISIWPSLIIRILVFILSVYFLLRTQLALLKERREVPDAFGFSERASGHILLGRPSHECGGGFWENLLWPFHNKTRYSQIQTLWAAFDGRRTGWNYLVFLIVTVLYLALSALFIHQDPPFVPYRGEMALIAHIATLAMSIPALFILCGSTFYIMMRCARLISHLYSPSKGRHRSCSWAQVQTLQQGRVAEHLNNIHLIGRITDTAGKAIVYPFIVLFIMVLTRYREIDVWDWPLPLVGIILLTILFSLYAAVFLRYKARQAKRIAVDELKFDLLLKGAKTQEIESCINEIEAYNKGAFSPLSSNPVLLAVLTPFGGLGIITILQSLMSTL